MDRQAAYDLLKCFLEKRSTVGLDCKRELPGLLAYGVTKGFFANPDTVFEEDEWRKFGDKLFDEVISEEKVAKKLMKPWRAVTNAITMHKAEQRAAAAAAERLSGISITNMSSSQQTAAKPPPDYPLPPSVRTIAVPKNMSGSWDLSQTKSTIEEEASPTAPPIKPTSEAAPGATPRASDRGIDPVLEKSDVISDRQRCWRTIGSRLCG